jgi:hypothetical protein
VTSVPQSDAKETGSSATALAVPERRCTCCEATGSRIRSSAIAGSSAAAPPKSAERASPTSAATLPVRG